MNGGIYSTGNEIVDENAKLNISGNIIPQVWYRTIIRESGKPNLTAIIILADIVYWYKPTEIRDEGTGQVIGVRKKFKSQQRSAKFKYWWLQSSHLKMSRYSLFCVYVYTSTANNK